MTRDREERERDFLHFALGSTDRVQPSGGKVQTLAVSGWRHRDTESSMCTSVEKKLLTFSSECVKSINMVRCFISLLFLLFLSQCFRCVSGYSFVDFHDKMKWVRHDTFPESNLNSDWTSPARVFFIKPEVSLNLSCMKTITNKKWNAPRLHVHIPAICQCFFIPL